MFPDIWRTQKVFMYKVGCLGLNAVRGSCTAHLLTVGPAKVKACKYSLKSKDFSDIEI